MLQIAIAMIGKPRILIIDGAFDGLDEESIKIVCKMLLKARENWRSSVLVGVSILMDELKFISSVIGTIDPKRGKSFFQSLDKIV